MELPAPPREEEKAPRRKRLDASKFSLEVRSDGRSFWLPAPVAWVMGGCIVMIAVLATFDPGRAGLAAVEAQADRVARWERAERIRQLRAVDAIEEPLRALRRRALERGLVPEGDLAATPCSGDPAAHLALHAGEVARLSSALSAAATKEGRVEAMLPSRSPIDLTRGEFSVVPDRELPGTVRVTSSRGPRADPVHGRTKDHKGVDISAPVGTPVVATADGTVVWAGAEAAATDHLRSLLGTHVVVEHGETGFVTLYAHLSKAGVAVGQVVVAGQEIGAVGTTGRSTGPHLHYQVMRGGVSLDPLLYIADVVLIEDGKAVRWRKRR